MIWSGPPHEYTGYVASIADGNLALASIAGDTTIPRCSRNSVIKIAEELGMVSRRGMPKGFLAALPRGKMLEACVNAFNVGLSLIHI